MKKALLVFVLIALCLPALVLGQYTQATPDGGMIDWTGQVIRAVGIGAPNPNMPIAAQRAGALEAAKRVALRNLLESVQGMNIDSEVTIRNSMTENDVIRNRVQGVVRNFRVVDTRYKSDGSVEVEVEVPLSGIIQAVMPERLPDVGATDWGGGVPTPSNVVYTGLIIDARGLGLRPALAPKVMDPNGNEIYGTGRVSREYALQIGVVGYEKELNRAKANERVTNNPLIVKATQVSGPQKTDVVISLQDAEQVRAAAQNLNFLQQCKVMLILD
ncbi:MAG: hypothetical protein Kow0037_23440 [Calditrichia bacterium]